MDLKLKGSRALVTGSGKGIGRGIALALAEQGCDVVVHYNYNRETAEETLAMLNAAGGEGRHHLLRADLSTGEGCVELIAESAERLGGLDILVNNAALQLNRSIDDYDLEHLRQVLHTNFLGYWHTIREAIPHLRASEHGRIICISSVHGMRPAEFDPVYSMSKAAIRMLVRETAVRLHGTGITCNALLPGGIRIEFKTAVDGTQNFEQRFHSTLDPEAYEAYIAARRARGATAQSEGELPVAKTREPRTLTGVIGEPFDVAYATLMLASPLGGHIDGASLRIDGASMLA